MKTFKVMADVTVRDIVFIQAEDEDQATAKGLAEIFNEYRDSTIAVLGVANVRAAAQYCG